MSAARLLLACATALAIAGCAEDAPARQHPGSELEARLNARNDSLLDAVRRVDAAAAASYYSEDASLLTADGRVVRGRSAIRSFWESGTAFDSVSTEAVSFRAESALAAQAGQYVIWSTETAGNIVASRGSFVLIWERADDGIWRIHADIWN